MVDYSPDQNTSLRCIDLPDIPGVRLMYDPEVAPYQRDVLVAAVAVVAHWLRHGEQEIEVSKVRTALRYVDRPHLLGNTDLARMLFGQTGGPLARGALLQRLLFEGINWLNENADASNSERQAYLILSQLYVRRYKWMDIAQSLGLSGRQYQRELKAALFRLVDSLRQIQIR